MWLINLMKERLFSVTVTILDPLVSFVQPQKKEIEKVGNFVTQLD